MRHRRVRPFGASIPPSRGLTMVMGLLIIAMIYQRARDPNMWRWLATAQEAEAAEVPSNALPAAAAPEKPLGVIPGPNDLDPMALEEFRSRIPLLTDRAPLRSREMLPYWQMMQWSLTEPLNETEKRADKEPAFSEIWEKPGDYRGRPIQLRLHLRRVLKYEATENPLGLNVVYEGWGWTENSKSFPYVIVFPEAPPGLPVGAEVEADVVFTGYFLKIMGYTAFDANRGAPLMVGRLRLVQPMSSTVQSQAGDQLGLILIAVSLGLTGLAMLYGWTLQRSPRKEMVAVLPETLGQGTDFVIPQDNVDSAGTSLPEIK